MQKLGCFLDCPAVRPDGAITGGDCTGGACAMFGEIEGECPVCGADMLPECESMSEESAMLESWNCIACGASITTVHSLQFSRHAINRPVSGVKP